jgi:hypothetical protein
MALNETALVGAFRRKYGTPRNLLRKLGFDSAEIDDVLEDNMHNLRPRRPGDTRAIKSLAARDEAGEPLDATSIIEFLDEALEDMPPEEADALADQLEERLLRDEPGAADRRAHRRAMDRRGSKPGAYRRVGGRLGKDEPEPFPGRPNPGGTMDPLLTSAQDRVASRRQLHGMDAAGLPAFEDLFPSVAKRNRSGDRDLGILPSLNL